MKTTPKHFGSAAVFEEFILECAYGERKTFMEAHEHLKDDPDYEALLKETKEEMAAILERYTRAKARRLRKQSPRKKTMLEEASEMAARGGYGFMGTTGMKSFSERQKIALEHLRRKRK